MNCFLTVLKAIFLFAAFMLVITIVCAVLMGAGIGTAWALGLSPGWGMAFMLLYFIVGGGSLVGISECRGF